MLSPLDDYPVHQIADVMRHVGTSDRNFYDRYYFNCHRDDGGLLLAFGLGQYPNLGVTDAFAVAVRGGAHRVVRASRELGADRMDTAVGPLRVEVLEGLRRLRITCDPAAGERLPLAFDLTWTGAVDPIREPHHHSREFGRVIVDSVRMAQTGRWEGALRVGDEEFIVRPDVWQGFRDRSWGIRPVGEPEPAGIRASRDFGTFYWLYVPMQFEKFSIFVVITEDADGNRVREQAVRVPAGGGAPESLGSPRQRLVFAPGTRDVVSCELTFAPPGGEPSRVRVTPLLPLHAAVGTGYGLDSDWRHGAYQGRSRVESLTLTAAEAARRSGTFGVVEQVSRFDYEGPDGHATGWGMFESVIIGPHRPSGLPEASSVAGGEPC